MVKKIWHLLLLHLRKNVNLWKAKGNTDGFCLVIAILQFRKVLCCAVWHASLGNENFWIPLISSPLSSWQQIFEAITPPKFHSLLNYRQFTMQVRAMEGCFHVDVLSDTLLKLMNQQNCVKFILLIYLSFFFFFPEEKRLSPCRHF